MVLGEHLDLEIRKRMGAKERERKKKMQSRGSRRIKEMLFGAVLWKINCEEISRKRN